MAAKDRQRLLDRLGKLANAEGKVAMKDVIKNNGSKKRAEVGTKVYRQLLAGGIYIEAHIYSMPLCII